MGRTPLNLALALAPTLIFVAPVSADEQEIALNRVPAVVRQAAARAVPGASWSKAVKEAENGRTAYELEGKLGDDREVSVVVWADGRVHEVSVEIDLAQVPAKVTAALRGRLPRYKPEEAASVSEQGRVTWYEFEGKGPDGKPLVVFVSADGKKVEFED